MFPGQQMDSVPVPEPPEGQPPALIELATGRPVSGSGLEASAAADADTLTSSPPLAANEDGRLNEDVKNGEEESAEAVNKEVEPSEEANIKEVESSETTADDDLEKGAADEDLEKGAADEDLEKGAADEDLEKGAAELGAMDAKEELGDLSLDSPHGSNGDRNTYPDGGLAAWFQVLIPWVIIGSTIGVLINQYGVFVDFWKTNESFGPDASLFQLSFGSSIAVGISAIISPFAGRYAERGHFRAVGIFGGVLSTLGFTLAGFATQPWHLFLTIGLLFGVGFGCIFTVAIVLPSHYFNKRRGFAVGITITGTGTFGFAFGPAIAAMLAQLGWQWTIRIVGLSLGCFSTLMACFMKPRIFAQNLEGKFFDMSHLKRKEFWVFAIVQGFEGFWYYSLFYFLPIYATYYGCSPAESAMLVSVLQISGLAGRVVLSYAFDRLGHLNGFVASYMLSMLTFFLYWPFAKTYSSLLGVSVIFGITIGGYMAMLLTSFADCMGTEDLATSSAMIFFCGLISQFLGGPISGILVDSQTQTLPNGEKVMNFIPMIMWAGASMVPGIIALIWLRHRQVGGKLRAVV